MDAGGHAVSSSAWSIRLALFSVGLVFAAALFHRLFDMATPLALNLFTIAFTIAGIAIVLGGFALFPIWQRGYQGTAAAVAAIVIGGLVLSWPLSLMPQLRALPMINDVTTDPARPPQFREIARIRRSGANSPNYPRDFAELQSSAYKDLQPLYLNRPPEEVFDLVGLAVRRLRMKTVNEVPYGSDGRRWGLVEAVDRTLVLGFYDDVAVRVSPSGRGTRIDVRSASRYGRHDLGRNAERIRTVLNEIFARSEASVPKGGRQRVRRGSRRDER